MANPTLNNSLTKKFNDNDYMLNSRIMTASGVVNKTIILFAFLLLTAFFSYSAAKAGFYDKVQIMMLTGFIGGLITCFFICFKPHSNYMVPATFAYAGFEGLLIGGVTGYYAVAFGMSLILNAVAATFMALLSVLFLYKTGIIKCTEKFKATIMAGVMGLVVLYTTAYVSSFFTPTLMNTIFVNGQLAFLINVCACIFAALYFIIDLNTIEVLIENSVPEKYEWYCGFSLMVTIVWLYLEILRLLARSHRR